ncbi:MAG: type II secretion system protein [Deltaproteobacteria bacterium]|nr:type II secretion system protein [Deltaproteobacteria bacterium]
MKRESGFTLIEVIVTLVLVGVMAAVAGIGIVSAMKGYVFAKSNTVIAGKAQVALARITRELTDLSDVTTANTAFIVFNEIEAGGSSDTVAIGQNGTQIKIAKGNLGTTPDYTAGDTLVDQVTTLSFAYKKGSDIWTTADDISLLSHIVVSLTMSGAGGGSSVKFNTTVSPRNNGNFGGAPPPTQENKPPGFGCFVATAAYGNPYHPMVLLLKQFRDQYLATWPGGRPLIQFYYKVGPYLAGMIQDKPWASRLARVLLLPFVVIAFLLVYAKGSIPLVILMIIVGIWLIKRYPMRWKFMKKSMAIHDEKGSVLIGLIVTMVIMAALGAALLALTSTSSVNQAYGVMAQKAYYLAESGFRYAGSQFLNVTDSNTNGKNDEQNSKTNDLNGRTLIMAEGSIQLHVIPFHYAASAAAALNATTLSVRFPGGTPASFVIPSTGQIQIKTQTYNATIQKYTTYTNTYSYTNFTTGSGTGTFTLSTGLVRAVPAWTSVTVIAQASSSPATQTITPNSDLTQTANRLTLSRPATGFFMPQYNGEFMIKGDPNKYVYKYAYRIDGTSTTTLYGVSIAQKNANGTEIHTQITVTASSYSIIPKDYFTVVSTGTVGSVSRTMTYITPVDIVASAIGSGDLTTSVDPFTAGTNPGDAASHWYAPISGSYSVSSSVSGGAKSDVNNPTGLAALRMTNSYDYGNWFSKHFSLIAIKWDSTYAYFGGSWYNNSNTLSYDTQVKMKLPQQDNYMAGMVFRLNLGTSGNVSDTSTLGAAFLRGNNGDSGPLLWLDNDGIEDGVVPLENVPMIVLWQKPLGGGSLSAMQWIAYKIIGPTINFNGGQNPFFANGANSYYIRGGASGARAKVISVGTADSGVTGSLDVSSVYSTFQTGEQLFQLINQDPNRLTGPTAQVNGTASSTSVPFNNGRDVKTGNIGILLNDIIVGRSSGAIARVTLVTTTGTGTWKNGSARGTLTITETEGGLFQNNEYLDVYRPSSTSSALFVLYYSLSDILTTSTSNYIKDWSSLVLRITESTADSNPFNGTDVNDIRIYVGDTALHGAPTGSPLDTLRKANLRWSNPPATDDIQWPPDTGWSSALDPTKDYFTLVQGWVMNSALASSFKLTGTTEEPNSTIRTTLFTTNGLTSFTQQEVGLQTAGTDMYNNTYFEDFAVIMLGAGIQENTGFSSPLQY